MAETLAQKGGLAQYGGACSLTVAVDLSNAGDFKGAARIFEAAGEYASAARKVEYLGDVAAMKGNAEESYEYYVKALDLYEKQIQKCIKEDTLKWAGQAALKKGELFGKLEMQEQADEERSRALDLFVRGYWYDEASQLADELGLSEKAEEYRKADKEKPRWQCIEDAKSAARAASASA
jgi:tetratricopeptide (TPR) repeat protein